MYLTLFISELPILPGQQVIISRVEMRVTDRVLEYPVGDLSTYLSSLAEVLETDIKSRGASPPDP